MCQDTQQRGKEMIKGLVSANMTIKPLISCGKCGVQEFTETVQVNIGIIELETLRQEISESLMDKFIKPPLGWIVSGHKVFKCETCKTMGELS